MGQLAGVKELHMCHHTPEHNDSAIDDVQCKAQARYAKMYYVKKGWEIDI